MPRSPGIALLALALSLAAAAPAAAGEFRIRLTYRGWAGPHTDSTGSCPGAGAPSSNDVLEGTVRGDEEELATEGQVVYRGTLTRRSSIDYCDLKPHPTKEWDFCTIGLTGRGRMAAEITILADRPGAYVTLEWVPGTAVVENVAGDCEAATTNETRQAYLDEGNGMEFAKVPRGALRERTSWGQPSRGPGDPVGPWTLEVLGRAGIDANPGGPYAVERATTVTLDGSRSTPSPGSTIRSYEWKLTPKGAPEGCAGIGRQTAHTGVTVTFTALCTVEAELTVRDDAGEQDVDRATVTVRRRPWKSDLTTSKKIRDQDNFTFVANGFVFGYNRCSRDGHFHPDKNHWFEPSAPGSNDYEKGTYWLDEVTDDGPFAGIHYVSRGEFEIPRAIWVNKKLYPGGDVHDLNPGARRTVRACYGAPNGCPFGLPVIDLLTRSVEAHEKLHSTLADQALHAGKDPATEAESRMGRDRKALKDGTNLLFTTAVSAMVVASEEKKVKAKLRGTPFDQEGCIDFPDWGSAARGGCYFYFPTFADKGE